MRVLAAVLLFLLPLLHPASVHGTDEFDFDPHQFVLDATGDSNSLEFDLPSSLNSSNLNVIGNALNQLEVQAVQLEALLDRLVDHFSNNASGPEQARIDVVKNDLAAITTQLKEVQGNVNLARSYKAACDSKTGPLTTTLQCLSTSKCKETTGPTLPPTGAPAVCTNMTISDAGYTGFWNFTSPTNFNCNLFLSSSKSTGLLFDMTFSDVKMWAGATITVTGNRGTSVTIDASHLNVTGARDSVLEVQVVGTVQFSLMSVSRDLCAGIDCGHGKCSADPTNKFKCTCDSCYSTDVNNTCTVEKAHPCETYGFMCTSTNPPGTCEVTASCSYYCKCPGVASDCTTNTYCDGSTTCHTAAQSMRNKKQSIWSRWFGF